MGGSLIQALELWFDVEFYNENRSQKLKYGLCLREKQIPL